MGSRPTTRDKGARLPKISRRALIAGTVASACPKPTFPEPVVSVALVAGASTAADGIRPLKLWLAIDHQIERYQDRWARLEAWLVRERAWFTLTPAEEHAHPRGRELQDIDCRIDALREKRDTLLEALPDFRAVSLGSIVTRLAVVERLIWPDDHPEAHALIAGARQDLIAFAAAYA